MSIRKLKKAMVTRANRIMHGKSFDDDRTSKVIYTVDIDYTVIY